MKKTTAIFSTLLLVAVCETNQQDKEAIKAQAKEDIHTAQGNVERHTMRIANHMRDRIKTTSMKLREWWPTPLPDQAPTAVLPSYCYQVLQDVVCYREPMPGMTHRLVGYQGDFAPAPPIAQTEMLPTLRIEKQLAETTGAARVKAAQPVFKETPEPPKKEESQPLDATPQMGSEPLPDPTLSPQL